MFEWQDFCLMVDTELQAKACARIANEMVSEKLKAKDADLKKALYVSSQLVEQIAKLEYENKEVWDKALVISRNEGAMIQREKRFVSAYEKLKTHADQLMAALEEDPYCEVTNDQNPDANCGCKKCVAVIDYRKFKNG